MPRAERQFRLGILRLARDQRVERGARGDRLRPAAGQFRVITDRGRLYQRGLAVMRRVLKDRGGGLRGDLDMVPGNREITVEKRRLSQPFARVSADTGGQTHIMAIARVGLRPERSIHRRCRIRAVARNPHRDRAVLFAGMMSMEINGKMVGETGFEPRIPSAQTHGFPRVCRIATPVWMGCVVVSSELRRTARRYDGTSLIGWIEPA